MIQITEKEFAMLTEYIHCEYGIELKKEKQLLLMGRLHKLLVELGFDSFTDYYHYLISDKTGEASSVLIDKVSTNHTFFMREPEHFEYFKNTVLPNLKIKKEEQNNRDIRLWCAASSTGEEPYTLAMLMADYFGSSAHHWDKKLLATDISNKVLDVAKKGIYDKERLQVLPPNWKLRYFKNYDSSQMVVVDEIKKEVIFRRFNLMTPNFVFKKKFDVIFCRNVMIYFDQTTKDRLVEKMYNYTEPGGYLFIGHAESLNLKQTNYKFIMPAVYQKPY
ncbi:MAG: chemotaxis protein methyltransferase CheR [Acetobacterium sp.]|jgi:chemotaxis protein methyltransferase CheR|uniref:CheR family methyltransferase n=1 Tax=unclassified Acetobacterium TaxID=2638182 RepID=UPI000DBEC1A3|nr:MULTISPECIES: protein-glutamate O-methyltransferase CheR [unclassified Acetobacterium]AWW25754.1 chemotaxis protein CheR [Acetobacterium sp. KB-1]MDK2941426.1 chemotaxis protein methyltransferase CheR [Acetobacterium sp.]MDZ5726590.1 protein-glutamate O-methyltransferase CheR [Acetobacterium sp. K1/6]